jgi:hypothetical protein
MLNLNFYFATIIGIVLCSSVSAFVASPMPVDKVIFSWIDEMGKSESVTDTQAPWALPRIEGQNYQMLPYLSTPGKKVITATAYNSDAVLKSQILEFEIIDSRIGRCDDLIVNSDLSSGYSGYWNPSSRGQLENVQTVFGKSVTAIRHSREPFTYGGPSYSSAKNMDFSCVTPGSSWEVNAQIGLIRSPSDKGVACIMGKSCPTAVITITDSSGNRILRHKASTYEGGVWNRNSFNNLKSTMTMPKSSEWDGTIRSIRVEIRGYRGTANFVVDSFSILRNQ